MSMSDQNSEIKLRYTAYSEDLHSLKDREDNDPLPFSIFDVLKSLVPEDGQLLDIGCGAGEKDLLKLLSHCDSYVGVEPSQELRQKLDSMRSKLEHGDRLKIHDGRVGSVDLEQKFDLVISRLAPHNADEAFRHLKPGGHYFVYKVGPLDKREMKKKFGKEEGNWRGYRCDQEEGDRRKNLENQFWQSGFEEVTSCSIFRDCYYPKIEDLILLLETVRFTVSDFDINSERDQEALKKIEKKHSTPRGIRVRKHELMVLGKKPEA